ncbi:MAG: Band 7 protein [Parcubacteria group bacterium GW2011_GWA2_40_23]|nr:MAG: Band 7 protein [Parcubacteria group bacterium GW2011_GWA2_40_23]
MDLSWLIPIVMTAGGVVALIALVAVLARNLKKVPPNKVLVFYGRKHTTEPRHDADGKVIEAGGTKGFQVVTGGSKWKWPILEDCQEMDMASFQMKPQLKKIPNKDGVLVNVDAVASCKIKSEQSSLSAAVERFLGKTTQEIHAMVLEILEGQLRAVIGTMTVEQLIQDRETLNTRVKAEAMSELEKLGVGIDILNIQSINDDQGYIEALGKKRTAEVVRDAAIGKAEAEAETKKRSTTAAKDADVLAANNQAMTFEADKDRDVKKATYDALIKAEQARAEQAGPMAKAEAEQKVVVQQVKVDEERERANIEVQKQKALVAAQAEEAKTVVPARKAAEALVATAEGAKKKLVIDAEGNRDAAVATAEGEQKKLVIESEGNRDAAINAATAEQKKRVLESEGARDAEINAATAQGQKLELEGKGKAASIRVIAEAEVYQAREVGKAQADAIEAKLLAEAKGILAKAEAYAKMDQRGALQLILEKLPSILEQLPAIVEAAAKPMSAIDKVVMIGSDPNAPAKFAGNVPVFLAQLFETTKNLGFDLSGALKKLGIDATAISGPDAPKVD